MIFQKFLEIKMAKKGFIKRGTRAELMWQHHLGRHIPMRVHVGAYMARRNRAKLIGPMGILGLGDKIGRGVY